MITRMPCCPRCGRRDIRTETTERAGVVIYVVYRCTDCGPVKATDQRETVTSILQGLDGKMRK